MFLSDIRAAIMLSVIGMESGRLTRDDKLEHVKVLITSVRLIQAAATIHKASQATRGLRKEVAK